MFIECGSAVLQRQRQGMPPPFVTVFKLRFSEKLRRKAHFGGLDTDHARRIGRDFPADSSADLVRKGARAFSRKVASNCENVA